MLREMQIKHSNVLSALQCKLNIEMFLFLCINCNSAGNSMQLSNKAIDTKLAAKTNLWLLKQNVCFFNKS